MPEQLGADIRAEGELRPGERRKVLNRHHVKAVWRTVQIHLIYGNQLNRSARHFDIGVKIAHSEYLIAKVTYQLDDFTVLQASAPVDIIAMHLEDNVRRFANGSLQLRHR